MRKEYYNYVVKLPVLLHELFRGKVADYHFSDMTVVMNHLVKSYIRMTDGGRVSTATRRILLCMDRIPDMSFFFRRQEKSVLFFEMDPAVALAVTTLVAGTDEVLTVRPLTHIGGRTNLQLFLYPAHAWPPFCFGPATFQ